MLSWSFQWSLHKHQREACGQLELVHIVHGKEVSTKTEEDWFYAIDNQWLEVEVIMDYSIWLDEGCHMTNIHKANNSNAEVLIEIS